MQNTPRWLGDSLYLLLSRGKRLLNDSANDVFHMAPHRDVSETCPVEALEVYKEAMASCGWQGGQGFLFPEIKARADVKNARGERPVLSRVMSSRLKVYATAAGLGERRFTMNSFKEEAAVARETAVQEVATVMASIGWKPDRMAERHRENATSQEGCRTKALEEAGEERVDVNELAASLSAAEFGFFSDS